MAAMFAPNESTVVLNCSNGRQYAYAVESGRIKSSFGPARDEGYALYSEQPVQCIMHFLPNNRFLSPGLAQKNRIHLYVQNFSAAETLVEFKGHSYPIDIVVTNHDQTLAASASGDTEKLPGKENHVMVWDLENYKLFSFCPKDMCSTMVSFCGQYDDLLLAGSKSDSPISVWYVGTKQKPCNPAILLHTLPSQHDVVYMETVLHKNLLISAALDNTIKIWNLDILAQRSHNLIDEYGKLLEVFLAEKQEEMQKRPLEFGEGFISTSCSALSQ